MFPGTVVAVPHERRFTFDAYPAQSTLVAALSEVLYEQFVWNPKQAARALLGQFLELTFRDAFGPGAKSVNAATNPRHELIQFVYFHTVDRHSTREHPALGDTRAGRSRLRVTRDWPGIPGL